ncbi:MAG: GNAT family N-acetyltransferase [Spirochaetia bacterium]|jgi:GNAT superfamily N-acetyltransferase
MAARIDVLPVTGKRERRAFVTFPWKVYKGDRNWVPPLVSDRLSYLDPKKGPFYKQADIALFMARQGGEPVGTIAGFVDQVRIQHSGTTEGGFGFFECINDPAVAARLLDACRDWLRSRGMTSFSGPTSFGEFDSPGVLIDGADCPAAMLEGHTPAYYRGLLEGYGMEKYHDFYAWRASFEQVAKEMENPASDIVRVAEAARRVNNVTVRGISMKNWPAEVATIRGLFNETMSEVPGTAPFSEVEFKNLSDQMKPFINPDLALIAETDGKPVAYCVLIPDTNQVLARLNGRLFPFNWLKLKRLIRKIDVVSFKLMGVLKEYQRRGIDAMLYVEALQKAMHNGYVWLDGSLTSELNPSINLIAKGRGAEMYKHYRLYRMALS